MIEDELIKHHSKIYKSYCDDLGKIVYGILQDTRNETRNG